MTKAKIKENDYSGIVSDLRKKKLDVSLLSDETSPCVVSDWVSTGCVALDKIMGGGLPVGRLVEIFGDQSTGKSLIAAQIAAVAQQLNHIVAYADSESAVSLDIMQAVGVDIDKLLYISPDTVEETFDFFDSTIDAKQAHNPDATLVLIWDSIAATSSDTEMESEFGKGFYGTHAKLISQALRKITRKFSKNKVAALFLNQTRQAIGVMFGDSTTTFGGKAVGFHSSIRIHLKLAGKIRNAKKKVIGVESKAIVIKNKVAVPFQETTFPVYFGQGIDDAGASLHWLLDNEFAIKAGIWTTLLVGGKELKFKRTQWPEIYEKHYEEISNLIFSDVLDSGGVEIEDIDDKSAD